MSKPIKHEISHSDLEGLGLHYNQWIGVRVAALLGMIKLLLEDAPPSEAEALKHQFRNHLPSLEEELRKKSVLWEELVQRMLYPLKVICEKNRLESRRYFESRQLYSK
jgi:hypothetical protein